MVTFADLTAAWSLAELPSHVGDIVGPSAPVLIDQKRIDAFAEATDDRQWIHLDSKRAASGPFGGTIAHGFLTLALLSHFMDELVRVADAGVAINYGLDRVRFAAPVLAGSSLRATVEIVAVDGAADRTMMRSRVIMTADGSSRPSCIAESITLYRPLGHDGGS